MSGQPVDLTSLLIQQQQLNAAAARIMGMPPHMQQAAAASAPDIHSHLLAQHYAQQQNGRLQQHPQASQHMSIPFARSVGSLSPQQQSFASVPSPVVSSHPNVPASHHPARISGAHLGDNETSAGKATSSLYPDLNDLLGDTSSDTLSGQQYPTGSAVQSTAQPNQPFQTLGLPRHTYNRSFDSASNASASSAPSPSSVASIMSQQQEIAMAMQRQQLQNPISPLISPISHLLSASPHYVPAGPSLGTAQSSLHGSPVSAHVSPTAGHTPIMSSNNGYLSQYGQLHRSHSDTKASSPGSVHSAVSEKPASVLGKTKRDFADEADALLSDLKKKKYDPSNSAACECDTGRRNSIANLRNL